MPVQSKEARIVMAIEALQSDQKLNVHKATQIYDVPETTLRSRRKGAKPKAEDRPKTRLLNKLEEEVLVQHIVDLDNRGFSPRLKDIEDMANNILTSRHKQPIGKL
jgi:hypothetical protein